MRQGFTGFARREQGGLTSVIALLVASSVVLSWPWISGKFSIPWDSKAHFLPQLQFLAQSLGSGESPFWTPYVFSGHAQVADPQSLIFSPPFFILALLNPELNAWAADTALYVVLLVSMVAMVVWLTDQDWHPAAALLSALAFGFGAAMAWRVQHLGQVVSLAYLPIVLLCLDRALSRHSILWAILWGVATGVAAACLVLGRDQVALLAVYFLAAYVPWRLWTSDNRTSALKYSIAPLSAAAIVGALLIAAPIALTLLAAADSNRPSIDFVGAGRGSLHPASYLTAFSADVFGASGRMGEFWGPPSGRWSGLDLFLAQNMGVLYTGALTICLVVLGAVSGVLWRREARFYTIAFIVTAVYAVGWYTPVFKLMHATLPGVDLYRRPADAVFNLGFLMSLLAGLTLNAQLQGSLPSLTAKRRVLLIAIPTSAFMTMVGLAAHFGVLDAAWPTIAQSAGIIAAAALVIYLLPKVESRSVIAASALVTAFMTADLATSNGPNGSTALPPETFEVLDPQTSNDTIRLLKQKVAEDRSSTRRDRVELVGFGFHWPNASLTHGLENTLGYNPVRSALYVQATGAGDHAGLAEQKTFSPLYPSYRSRLADLLGLRYIATSFPVEEIDKALKPGDLNLVAKTRDGYVYENPRALPRVLFAGNAQIADFDAILKTGAWPAFVPEKTVLLNHAPATAEPAGGTGRIVIEAYHHSHVTLYVDSSTGGYAVLNDLWHPWWVARLDGAVVPIERANVLFRAVAVPAGKHRIEMTFEPFRGAWKQLRQQWEVPQAASN